MRLRAETKKRLFDGLCRKLILKFRKKPPLFLFSFFSREKKEKRGHTGVSARVPAAEASPYAAINGGAGAAIIKINNYHTRSTEGRSRISGEHWRVRSARLPQID